MHGTIVEILRVSAYLGLAYFAAYTAINVVLAVVSWNAVEDFVRRRPMRDYDAVARSPLSLPVSILVPAYNEGPVIVPAVRALLESQYTELEAIVVNDGSKDDTMQALLDGFDLVEVERVPSARLDHKPVRAVYVSRTDRRVVVIDKDNGGKADALNAAIAHARNPLVCAIDADTMLDPGALARLVWEFQSDPDTVAVGGIVRIINGSKLDNGRLQEVRTPSSLLVNLQILEYLRAFLAGRVAWSRMGMLLIVSGAFGLFRRDVCVEVGGYDTNTVGEDAELIVRLHRHRREQGRACRVTFFPDPICWTEAPAEAKVLIRQRDRWQRGLIQTLSRHRVMIGRRRYGRIGLVAMPYFVIFEMLGPTIEMWGFVSFLISLALGAVSGWFAIAFLSLSLLSGLVLSFITLLMEQRAFRRYPTWADLRRLVLVAVIENFGWRQVLSFVRFRSWWTVRADLGWGEMQRAGFGTTAD